jgi:TRAP transporter TAXI family solute receptor
MKRISLIVTMLAFGISGASVSAEDEIISIGTGNTVGMYYSTSSAVAKLFNYKRQEYKQWIITVASEGSDENVNDVLSGKVQFGFSQANVLDKAVRGIGPWKGKPHKNLRAVLKLYTEELTIVTDDDAKILRLADLKGKRVNIGASGSNSEEAARRFFKRAGINLDEITLLEEQASKSSDMLKAGEIDAYLFTVGHPSFSVREASSGERKVRLLSIDQKIIDLSIAETTLVKEVTIPTTYYPKLTNTAPIKTLGTPAILFTTAEMSEETVYRMVKEVMTNLDLFRRQQPVLADLDAKEMGKPIAVPLHPGAVRYFKEAGLLP